VAVCGAEAGAAGAAGAPVDQHIAACETCRDHLATLEHADRSLTSLLSSTNPSPDFADRVQARAPRLDRPRMLPELLDLAGWSAIIAILSLVALYWAAPSIPILAVAATVSVAAAVALSLRSFADLREW
jgi:anti-sigma factor RsiW